MDLILFYVIILIPLIATIVLAVYFFFFVKNEKKKIIDGTKYRPFSTKFKKPLHVGMDRISGNLPGIVVSTIKIPDEDEEEYENWKKDYVDNKDWLRSNV